MEMDSFIASLNIARFKEILKWETDPTKQDALRRLLAEEEKRLERNSAAAVESAETSA